MVSALAAPVPSRATHRGDIWPDVRPFTAISVLLLCQAGALVIQALAVFLARRGAADAAGMVSACGYGLAYASVLWSLTRPQLTRALRNTAVVCLGMTTAVLRMLPDPLLFTSYDEQQHARTLNDIVSSHRLFSQSPTLGISPRYPGLESVAALFHQLGLPVMVAAIAVVLVARLALVVVLCDAVEHLTGSPRAGGLAVAVYAVSSHFVCFNTTFSYQTLALSLALAAIAFIARARWAADPRPSLWRRHCMSARRRCHPSPHQLAHRGLSGFMGYCGRRPGEAARFLRCGIRSGHDRRVGNDSVVHSAGLFRSDDR